MVIEEVEAFRLPGRWNHESTDGIYASLFAELALFGTYGTSIMTAIERMRPRMNDVA
jgi:hypothetical protein